MKKSIQEIGLFLGPLFLVFHMFFLPISHTLLSVFLVLGSLTLISIPYYRRISYYTWGSASGFLGIALLVFVCLGTLWSPAPFAQGFSVVTKYFKFFYLPIVAVSFINPKMRFAAFNAYLAAMVLTCILSIYYYFQGAFDPGQVFHNHIATSFMIAFASYIAGLFMFKYRGWMRSTYALIFLLTSGQIVFINTGRTGYVVYFLLMICLLVQQLTPKKALLGTVLLSVFMVGCYEFTPSMNARINILLNDIELLRHNQTVSSTGFRLAFHNYSKSLMAENPLRGIGTGGFKYRFLKDNPIPSWGTHINEPHSQYWFLLAENGLIGLFLFCAFLVSLVFFAFRELKETRPILLGFLLVFAFACLADTLFSYSVIGYLLIMVTAICFGEYHELREGYQMAMRSTGFPNEHSSEMEPSLQTISPLS